MTPIPFGLQPCDGVAIFVLRTEYVISVTHPKHIYHKFLLILRRCFARSWSDNQNLLLKVLSLEEVI